MSAQERKVIEALQPTVRHIRRKMYDGIRRQVVFERSSIVELGGGSVKRVLLIRRWLRQTDMVQRTTDQLVHQALPCVKQNEVAAGPKGETLRGDVGQFDRHQLALGLRPIGQGPRCEVLAEL